MSRRNSVDSVASAESLSERHDREDKIGFLSILKQKWDSLGLDRATVLLMMKGGIAPTIAVSIYQADSVASEYSTVGYLIAVVSVLGFAIMPRAKFIQMLVLDLFAVCTAAAFAMLMAYTSVKARENTSSTSSSPGAPPDPNPLDSKYNSSASAVCGIWLFFQIYLVHCVRAKYPQFQFPTIIYAIFANISSTNAAQLTSVAAATSFVKRMLAAFLTGLAISTGTSLLILPRTTRQLVFKQMAGYIGGIRSALKAQSAYFETLEHDDMFGRAETYDETIEKMGKKGKVYSPEAQAIRNAVRKITELHAKLHGDLTFAKREFAMGKLGPDDLQAIFRHLRQVMTPVVGLSFVVDIFQRLSDYNKWNEPIDATAASYIQRDEVRERVVHEWNDIMRAVHDPFASMIETIDEGLQHILYVLQLAKRPKKPATSSQDGSVDMDHDVEASASAAPGDKQFAAYFERKIGEFRMAKRIALRTWCEEKGIKLPAGFFDDPSSVGAKINEDPLNTSGISRDRSRRQLYLFLYMEQLLHSTGQVVLDFIRFADEREASGKLSKTRLIIPGGKRLRKWVMSTFKVDDTHEDDNIGDVHTHSHILQLGEAYKLRKDPEHLPPETTFQRIGDRIRWIPGFLRSTESAYGFRVACATMTIAIVAYLHDTQTFFIKQRLVWALIIINLSMSPTSGQSIFSFVLRLFGTFIAMVGCFLIWYIPAEKPPGAIVFLFVFISCFFYVPIKMFRFRIMGIIGIMTVTIVIGYELQVSKVGEAAATSNGQPYYPVYLLAPYRLATVVAGIAVAFFWTFFPYPISEHSVLRQSLGASLYLLANYYSIIHETVSARMRGDEGGDMRLKGSAGQKLEKARNKVFTKQMLMLNGLRTYSGFLKWEVPIGGRFPKRKYKAIILCVENIANYLSLLGYASDTLMRLADDPENHDSEWFRNFKRLVASASVTSHEITSVLCLLSASITNRQPLPPYLKTPRPYSFSKRLEELDKDILNLRYVAEPGFAAFAVLQVSSRCILGDMQRLMRDVKSLVGELDFSFHAVSTGDASRATSLATSRPISMVSVNEYYRGRSVDRDKMD